MGKVKRAIRNADKGNYSKAQQIASKIKDGKKSLDTKRTITGMENTAGAKDFYLKGGSVRRDSLLCSMSGIKK